MCPLPLFPYVSILSHPALHLITCTHHGDHKEVNTLMGLGAVLTQIQSYGFPHLIQLFMDHCIITTIA